MSLIKGLRVNSNRRIFDRLAVKYSCLGGILPSTWIDPSKISFPDSMNITFGEYTSSSDSFGGDITQPDWAEDMIKGINRE